MGMFFRGGMCWACRILIGSKLKRSYSYQDGVDVDRVSRCFRNFIDKVEALRKESQTDVVGMVKCFRALALDVISTS